MLRMKILRLDGSVIGHDVEVRGQNARRGTRDGHVWRGVFCLPDGQDRPALGETLVVVPAEDQAMSAIVTEVEGSEIHFRAPGRVPTSTSSGVRSEFA
jgi:hypothetical protein